MIRKSKTKNGKVRYGVRVHVGGGKFEWLGTYPTMAKARRVEADWLLRRNGTGRKSGREFAEFWLDGYEKRHKASSYDSARSAVKRWLETFGNRSLHTIDAVEAEEWARENRWAVPPIVTMLNDAVDKKLIESNPFAGQSKKGPGRRDLEPLTVDEVDKLAWIATGLHGDFLGRFVIFAAYTGMRIGEIFPLEWRDIEEKTGRIKVRRRLYRGLVDVPKNGKAREIVLTPEARDALMGMDRSTKTVFRGKGGGRMSQSGLAYYWTGVCAAFGRKVAPHELRHFCGHHMYVTLGMPSRVVAVQLGHTGPRLVEELYGHGDVGALEEIEARLASNVVPLRRRATG